MALPVESEASLRDLKLVEKKDPTRNGFIRDRTKPYMHNLTMKIHERWPKLTPNKVTLASLSAQAAGISLAEAVNRSNISGWKRSALKTAGLLFHAAGALGDGFDGELARIKNQELPGSHDQRLGGHIDYFSDRLTEITASRQRQKTAHKKGNSLGETAALADEITTCLPGVARAVTEAKGKAASEQGKNIFEMLGTRVGRVVLIEAATAFPRYQEAIDFTAASANIYAAHERLKAGRSNEPEIVPGKKREDAKLRVVYLAALSAISANRAVVNSRRHLSIK